MIPLNYHHLYYFYTISKTGSISRACKELRLAQPTLSMQLKQFETWLEKDLFERRSRRLFLTEMGRTVYEYAEKIFDLGLEMQDVLRDQPKGGHLRVQLGVVTGTPHSMLEAALVSLLTAHPQGQVSVLQGGLPDLIRELDKQRLDCILTDDLVPSSDEGRYTNHLIGKVPVFFVGSPRLSALIRRFPKDLEKVPLILPTAPGQVYQQVLDLLASHKLMPRIAAEVQDAEIARRLVLNGHGVAPLNSLTISASRPKEGLVILGKKFPTGIHENLYLVIRNRKWENPLVRHLIENFKIGKA